MHILRLHWGCYRCMLISCRFVCYFLYNISIFFNRYVDFINVMAYDYSGPWSHKTGFMAPLYSRSSDKSFDQTLSQVDNFYTIFFNDKWMPFEKKFSMCIWCSEFLKIKKNHFIIIIKHIHEGCMIQKFEVKYTPLYL